MGKKKKKANKPASPIFVEKRLVETSSATESSSKSSIATSRNEHSNTTAKETRSLAKETPTVIGNGESAANTAQHQTCVYLGDQKPFESSTAGVTPSYEEVENIDVQQRQKPNSFVCIVTWIGSFLERTLGLERRERLLVFFIKLFCIYPLKAVLPISMAYWGLYLARQSMLRKSLATFPAPILNAIFPRLRVISLFSRISFLKKLLLAGSRLLSSKLLSNKLLRFYTLSEILFWMYQRYRCWRLCGEKARPPKIPMSDIMYWACEHLDVIRIISCQNYVAHALGSESPGGSGCGSYPASRRSLAPIDSATTLASGSPGSGLDEVEGDVSTTNLDAENILRRIDSRNSMHDHRRLIPSAFHGNPQLSPTVDENPINNPINPGPPTQGNSEMTLIDDSPLIDQNGQTNNSCEIIGRSTGLVRPTSCSDLELPVLTDGELLAIKHRELAGWFIDKHTSERVTSISRLKLNNVRQFLTWVFFHERWGDKDDKLYTDPFSNLETKSPCKDLFLQGDFVNHAWSSDYCPRESDPYFLNDSSIGVNVVDVDTSCNESPSKQAVIDDKNRKLTEQRTRSRRIQKLLQRKKKLLEEMVTYLESWGSFKFEEGYNRSIIPMRVSIDNIRFERRPWIFYVATQGICQILTHLNLRKLNFVKERSGTLQYYRRSPSSANDPSSVMNRTGSCHFINRDFDDVNKDSAKSDNSDSFSDNIMDYASDKSDIIPSDPAIPLVFCHGIGVGLFAYLMFVQKLVEQFPDRTIFLPLLPHIALRIQESVISASEMVACISDMLSAHYEEFAETQANITQSEKVSTVSNSQRDRKEGKDESDRIEESDRMNESLNRGTRSVSKKRGIQKHVSDNNCERSRNQDPRFEPEGGTRGAHFIGHSFGTIVMAWVCNRKPELVKYASFLDPVCFLLVKSDVCYNFIYKPATKPIELFRQYIVSSELHIANTMARHFFWNQNILLPDTLINKVESTLVTFCENDSIIPAHSLRRFFLMLKNKHKEQRLSSTGKNKETKSSDGNTNGSSGNISILWYPQMGHGEWMGNPRYFYLMDELVQKIRANEKVGRS